jgi:hypothetical protein
MGRLSPADKALAGAANDLMLIVAALEAAPDSEATASETTGRRNALIALLEGTRPDTEAGLVAKAAALLAEGPGSNELSRQERLAISLATDVLRQFGNRLLPQITDETNSNKSAPVPT